jgi:hypothetical protein
VKVSDIVQEALVSRTAEEVTQVFMLMWKEMAHFNGVDNNCYRTHLKFGSKPANVLYCLNPSEIRLGYLSVHNGLSNPRIPTVSHKITNNIIITKTQGFA